MPSMRKHQPSLVAAITTPAIEGPISRARFTIDEFRAIALPRSRLVLDHREEKGLPGGHVERVDDPLHDAQGDDPLEGDPAGQHQRGEGERLQHRDRLGDDQQAMAIPAVHDDAGERTENERRKLAREADDAKEEGRAGQAVDEPVGRGRGDPRADERYDLAAEEEPVVAVGERAQHERDGGRPFGHVAIILATRCSQHEFVFVALHGEDNLPPW